MQSAFSAVAEKCDGIWYFSTPGAGYVTGAVLDMNGGLWTGG
jgi:hypothetical protein